MPAEKRITRRELDRIERAAKREAQKAAGAFDGRFRPRVVPGRKRYDRKRQRKIDDHSDGAGNAG